ncbi:hypothetical protein C8A00DRAFT_44779 [Chaetomidium leptoderma]|uniref:Uncharacterized protein n=1 Tax=Chaetomidium leptoderma TaxID=669021 RepID=A0AAN6VKV4_9PEZI|nr:hypothetical protein C8A00DRAFT_44779 [Chaetomidium leptoderma]
MTHYLISALSLQPVLSSYYERVHNDKIARSVLLFQVLDTFLRLEPYLPREREFYAAVRRYTFRYILSEDGVEGLIRDELTKIVKRLRVFHSAYRTRAKLYLTMPAPERLLITVGKSLLHADIDKSIGFLDTLMLRRL